MWTVLDGRSLCYNGKRLCYLTMPENRAGPRWPMLPADCDALVHHIAAGLNAAGVNPVGLWKEPRP